MKVFLLTHFDSRDYYVRSETLMGVYATNKKAENAWKKESSRREHKGPLHPPPEKCLDEWFEITEWNVE